MLSPPLTSVVLSRMEGSQIASISSLPNFSHAFMGGVRASVVNTTWERHEALYHTQLTGHIDSLSPVSNQSTQDMMVSGSSEEQALAAMNSTTSQQGSITGSNEIFLVSGIIFISMIPTIWLARPSFNGLSGRGH